MNSTLSKNRLSVCLLCLTDFGLLVLIVASSVILAIITLLADLELHV